MWSEISLLIFIESDDCNLLYLVIKYYYIISYIIFQISCFYMRLIFNQHVTDYTIVTIFDIQVAMGRI